ncbi:2-oxoglutarate and iron-dependent oxygenase domain-containing protein [Phenylobacterium sp.]|uniref:isopenicillin N synthase family dioxygenase n=1 Tax=Phenylobacterium sp. TaxID=1871053 RepID=UPI00286B023D|nr:2-oxoglutarate and iron-dependent oxygenase domain-containing protein [Phenylobacterium sp.]
MSRNVPELSLKAFTHGDGAARAQFSIDLMAGLQDYGFIILKDHNVPVDLLNRAYSLAERVFALPDAEKRRHAKGLRGYTPFGVEHAKDNPHADLKEFWQIGREPRSDLAEALPPNVWPDQPGFQETFSALFAGLDQTGALLLRALAPGLGLDEGYFDPLVKDGTSILRVLHYPPIPGDADPGCVRSAAHEDINFITILVAAKGAGLQLLDRDGTWMPVETAQSNLIVDSGDMLARLTNGVIPSTTHRVVNPDGPNVSRYSMPFFLHPTSATSLEVLPSCLGDGAKFPPITAGAFLDERLKAIGLAK